MQLWNGAVTGFGENGQNTLSVWEVVSSQTVFIYPVNCVYDMAWRPHSTQISLVTDIDNMNGPSGNILLIDITSGDITRLTESARSLRWDETGTILYAGSYRDNTFAYNLIDGTHTL